MFAHGSAACAAHVAVDRGLAHAERRHRLGQGREDVEDELAAPGGGDRLLEAAEPDPAVGQAGDGVDQVPQGAAEAVELQTTGVSPGRSWSRTRVRVGRSVRAPLAVSVNTR
jgi:hypothetical protein